MYYPKVFLCFCLSLSCPAFLVPYGRTESVRPCISSIIVNLMEIIFLQVYYPPKVFFCVFVCLCLSVFFLTVRTDVRPSDDNFHQIVPSVTFKIPSVVKYYPKVFCVSVCLFVFVCLFFGSVRTDESVHHLLNLWNFGLNLMEISIPSDVIWWKFHSFRCITDFLCFCLSLSVRFFWFRTDGRSPSVRYWISIRLCHRSRCVPQRFSVFSVCLCPSTFLDRTDGQSRYWDFRLCHRSRLIYPKVSVFLFVCCLCLSFFFWFHVTDGRSVHWLNFHQIVPSITFKIPSLTAS
jgi:hypothetical protein